MMQYRLVYRDGHIGEAHPWDRLLWILQFNRALPYPYAAVRCVSAWDEPC